MHIPGLDDHVGTSDDHSMTRVLLTGAAGFVGTAVGRLLDDSGVPLRRALRVRVPGSEATSGEAVVVGEIDGATDWNAALDGVDTVLHLAARVHHLRDTAGDPDAEYRRVNTDGTEGLLRAAIRKGVRRFVFVSTIKVNGEHTTSGRPFRASDPIDPPTDPYARSKWEAEQVVWQLSRETATEAVIVRPPLVYGPGVGANFLRMMQAIERGIPLPLNNVRNERSLVFVRNLADLLVRCLQHPAATGRTLLVADGPPLSTPELLREVGAALDRPVRMIPAAPALLRLGGRILGRSGAVERLVGSLAVDDQATREALDWNPPYTLREGLQQTVAWYRGRGKVGR